MKICTEKWSSIVIREHNALKVDKIIEPRFEKTGLRGFRPGPTQTGPYSYRKWLESCNFVFRKKRDCTIRAAKNKRR